MRKIKLTQLEIKDLNLDKGLKVKVGNKLQMTKENLKYKTL